MTSQFFERKPSAPLKRHGFQGEFVTIGASNDSCFKAIAAVIVDTILRSPATPLTYVQPLFDRYFQTFSIAAPRNLREFVRQRMFIAHQAGNLLTALAFILRQMLVDQLVNSPEKYRSAFYNGQVFLGEQALRSAKTPINLCAYAALAQILQAQFLIRISEDVKEIALPLRSGKKTHSLINFYLQGDICYISAHHYHLFKQIDFKQASSDSWLICSTSQDTAIEKQIAQTDDQRLKNYQTHVNRLHVMYKANEICKDDLLSMYIGSIGTNDVNGSENTSAGMEHGSQKYFTQLFNGEAQAFQQLRVQAETYDEKIVVELIFAVSRALSLGQISEDKIYNNLAMTP